MNKKKHKLLIVWLSSLLLSTGILVWGTWWYKQQENLIRKTWIESLNSIAEVKKNQITAWRQERLAGARVFSNLYRLPKVLSFIPFAPLGGQGEGAISQYFWQ
jgi:hypothetical protein